MSFWDSLFGGGGSSQVTTTDAYKKMPQFLKDMIEAQAKAQTAAVGDAEDVRRDLADPNKSIAPLNSVEQAGLNAVTSEQGDIDALARRGETSVGGIDAILTSLRGNDPSGAVARGAGLADSALAQALGMTSAATVQPGMTQARAAAGDVGGDVAGLRDLSGQTGGIDIGAFETGYENPYIDSVVNTTLSRFDEDLARRQVANEMAAATLGGTTNSRRAVADAMDQQLTTREKGAAEAGLRADAFDTSRRMALERGGFELDRLGMAGDLRGRAGSLGLERAGVLGDLALNEGRFGLDRAEQYGVIGSDRGRTAAELALDNARFGVARDTAGGQMALDQGRTFTDMANARSSRALTEGSYLQNFGEKLRGLDQARLDAPKDALSWFSTVSSTPNAPTSTSQTVSNSGGNTWAQLGGAALGAYQILSDERAKTEVEGIDPADAMRTIRELRPSTYEYRPGLGQREGRTAGLMAQDLESLPGAVSEGADGYKRVDPYPVLATLAAAVQDLDRRIG